MRSSTSGESSSNQTKETNSMFSQHSRASTFTKQAVAAMRQVDPLIYCYTIAILLSYITTEIFTRCPPRTISDNVDIDLLVHHNRCGTLEGHLPMNETLLEDAWHHMKWTGKPAQCKVKGHLIESLDAAKNFRRGYALRFTRDVEDKTHILPWLLANQENLSAPPRRVLLDLGGNRFDTSITWFMRMYPCDFTEVHVFEIDRSLFKLPENKYDEAVNVVTGNADATVVRETPGIPQWMLRRMKVYNVLVSDNDDAGTNAMNITRFMKEDLKLEAGDAVVVKMDIEGSEWPILQRWMGDSAMAAIVDELFVEVHYGDATMGAFWGGPQGQFGMHSRDDAVRLLAGLRSKGFFVHAWP